MATVTEAGEITGTQDEDDNIIWLTEVRRNDVRSWSPLDEPSGGAESDTIPPDAATGIGSADDGADATTTTCP